MTLRIVFMGTPHFAVPVLQSILAAGHEIVAVYSQPPRPAGRGLGEMKSPVHELAEAKKLLVRTPLNFKAEADCAAFQQLNADVAVVVAYGLLLPEAILNAPRLGCFNVHASKLPRWRGAAPVQRAIMAGDRETAVTIMRMEKGLDTGPVCLTKTVAIPLGLTSGDLHGQLSADGAVLMVEALQRLEDGHLCEMPQNKSGITYAAKIEKAETHIDFSRSAADVLNHIHGLSPVPGAWFALAEARGERVKVLEAEPADGQGTPGHVLDEELVIACRDGAIRLKTVQRAGKKAMTASDFLRGVRIVPGTYLV